MPSAARLGDQVLHSQALPQAKQGWWGGLLKGALIGAAIVAVTAVVTLAAIAITGVTGGLGAPFAIGAAVLIIGSALRYAQVGFHEGAQAGALQGTRAGPIKTGSRNVFINGKAAALACVSLVSCTQHGDGKQVAQGSQTVAINGHRMARVGDGGVCGFVIGEGSPNVFAGAPPTSCHGLAVGSEIPKGLSDAVDTAGKIGGYMEIAGGLLMGGKGLVGALTSWAGRASLAAVMGIGYEGSKLATDYAKRHGMSASNQMMFGDFGGLTASVVGGGALGLGARFFGGAPVVETPVEAPVETPPLVDRATLNPEDIFPGQQSGNNCAPQSAQQIARVATGNNISEADMAASAQASAGYDPAVGTPAGRVPEILNANGVPARTMPNTPESIQGALDNGQGVISAHRAEDLWPGDPNFTADPNNPISGGHAVHTIDTVRGPDGEVTGYLINDTGTGTAGRVVPTAQYEGSLMDNVPATVTNDPIYAPYKPIEALAPDAPAGTAGDESLGATNADTIQHVHQGETVSDPQSPYDGKWNGKGLHDWGELQNRVTKDGYSITDVREDPATGVRDVDVQRSGIDPKIVASNEKILNNTDPTKYLNPDGSPKAVRNPQVTSSFTKTVYPKAMSAPEIDAAGEQALNNAANNVNNDPNTTLRPYGATTKPDGSPIEGKFDSPVTTPQGQTIRVRGFFTQDASGTQTITSHFPVGGDPSWPSIPDSADW